MSVTYRRIGRFGLQPDTPPALRVHALSVPVAETPFPCYWRNLRSFGRLCVVRFPFSSPFPFPCYSRDRRRGNMYTKGSIKAEHAKSKQRIHTMSLVTFWRKSDSSISYVRPTAIPCATCAVSMRLALSIEIGTIRWNYGPLRRSLPPSQTGTSVLVRAARSRDPIRHDGLSSSPDYSPP